MRRPKKRGFTLAEVLVSIAVLTISISGVLSALAYDAFSSEQSGAYTFALNYTRRVLDLMQSGQIDPLVFPASGTPALVTSNNNNDGVNWRDLDAGLLGTGGGTLNFWGAPGSKELMRFNIEKQKYGVNIVQQRVVPAVVGANPTDHFKNLLVDIFVTTRWRQRSGFRSVQLRGYYVTSPS